MTTEKLNEAKEKCESILPKAWQHAKQNTPTNKEGHAIIPTDEWRDEPDWE